MRPALKAGLRPLWRDRDTLQFGVDPRRARGMTGLGKAAAVISLLDGSRETAAVLHTAMQYGVAAEAVDQVLSLLSLAGLLDDFPADIYRALPDSVRARLAPELACAALAYGHGDGGAAVLARRRAAFVRVYGAGRIGTSIAALLGASGVGWVHCRARGPVGPADTAPGGMSDADVGNGAAAGAARAVRRVAPEVRTTDDCSRLPDLAVLIGHPDPLLAAELVRDGVPHLAAAAEEAIGAVGPLVEPGRTACLRCLDLSKAASDPAWPRILAQVSGPAATTTSTLACDTVLAASTAALAAAQALIFIDRARRPATACGTILELVLPNWQWRQRQWPPHPACTCRAVCPRGENPPVDPPEWGDAVPP